MDFSAGILTRCQTVNGDFYFQAGRVGEAQVYFGRGLCILVQVCSPHDPQLFEARKQVADYYVQLGLCAKAEPLLEAMVESLGGHADGNRLESTLLALGKALEEQNKYRKAVDVMTTVIEMLERQGVPRSERAVAVYRDLSLLHAHLGETDKSALLAKTASSLEFLQICEAAVGRDSISLTGDLDSLRSLYLARGQLALAGELITRKEICRLSSKVSGSDYPGVEADLEHLASLIDARGEPGDATVAFHMRARAGRIKECREQRR